MDQMEKRFYDHVSEYDTQDERIDLKLKHSYEVAQLADRIADAVGADRKFAYIIGLLHDIGRFEQIRQCDTFDDMVLNHGVIGTKILFEDGLYDEIVTDREYKNEKWRKIAQMAIFYHNTSSIPDCLDKETQTYCKILRDADKLGIFRVHDVYHRGMLENITENTPKARKEIFDCVIEHRIVTRDKSWYKIASPFEYMVSIFCLWFDINYRTSKGIAKAQGYLKNLLSIKTPCAEINEQLKIIDRELGGICDE